jgi:mono/diheme cytochrome c family protein
MVKLVFIVVLANIIGCAIKPQKKVPEEYLSGQEYFHKVCAICHGADARGGNRAPSLLQEMFRSTKFSNQKIANTILNGSKSGAMPSQKQRVNDLQIREIIKYIRFSQREAGMYSP